MNKKGFTLIELLATIVILAIIMVIAVPNVINTLDKNKRSTYVEDAKRMITLAEYEFRRDTSIARPTTSSCVAIRLETLGVDELSAGPEGGSYDIDDSYVKIELVNSSYRYSVQLIENYGDSRRGLSLITRDALNEEDAIQEVATGDDLVLRSINCPNVY